MSVTKVSFSMISGAFFNVLDYGAVGDGSTNDTTAIQDTYAAAVTAGGGTVFLPYTPNGYKFSSLTFDHSNVNVVGDGFVKLTTTASSGSAITVAYKSASAVNTDYFVLSNFTLVGNATADVGLDIKGDGTYVNNRFRIDCVNVNGFTKATAITTRFEKSIEGLITNCAFEGGKYACAIFNNATVLRFVNSQFRVASFCGLYTETGCLDITFDSCVFESNYGPGVYMHGGVDINFNQCWWENNNRSSQTPTATVDFNYSFVCDASAGGYGQNGPTHLEGCYFNGGGTYNGGSIYLYNAASFFVRNTVVYLSTLQVFIAQEGTTNNNSVYQNSTNITYIGLSDFNSAILGSPNVYINRLGASQYGVVTLANSAASALGINYGVVMLVDKTNNTSGSYWLNPATNTATFVGGNASKWNNAGGAGYCSVYFFAGEFRVLNETGGSVNIAYAKVSGPAL